MAQWATTALAGAVPRLCVRGARGRFRGLGPVPGVVSLPFPPSRPASPALRVAGRPVRVSLAGTPFHAVCAFRELGPVALLVVPACPLRVCALVLPRRLLRPPWVAWRAHLARSRHWALVGPFRVVRAPPRVLPRSLAPSGVLGGGVPVLLPPYLAWGCAPAVARVREGRLVSDAVPPSAARPLGRVAGVMRPVCPRCGPCGRGDPAPAPQCAPLRVGVARRGGGGRASPGGVTSTVARGV